MITLNTNMSKKIGFVAVQVLSEIVNQFGKETAKLDIEWQKKVSNNLNIPRLSVANNIEFLKNNNILIRQKMRHYKINKDFLDENTHVKL